MKTGRWIMAVVLCALAIGTPRLDAQGVTIKSGQVIMTQTAAAINTATLKEGDTITLDVMAPYPQDAAALSGAAITLMVTGVTHEAPKNRARVAFLFEQITFKNGRSQPIAAYVMSSKVTRRGTTTSPNAQAYLPPPNAAAAAPRPNLGPAMSNSSTIFWQRTVSKPAAAATVTAGSTGGYAYTAAGDVTLPAGTSLKVQLAADLPVPE